MGVANELHGTLDVLCGTEAHNVLKDLAVAMFTAGAEAAVVFGTLKKIAGSQTVRLWKLVKQAIHELYESKAHRDAICRSPERPDLRLAQEEAQTHPEKGSVTKLATTHEPCRIRVPYLP